MSEKMPLYKSPGEKGKRRFEDLECYQLALEAMAKIHAFSRTLPAEEKYDLYAQIRRATKGVTANIAEAYGRYHDLDSLHYYSIARGELNETLAHLINARVLEYIDPPDFDPLYKFIRQAEQALNGFMAYVRRQRAGSQDDGDKELVKANQIMMRHPSMRRVTKMQLTCLMYIPVYSSTCIRTPKVSR